MKKRGLLSNRMISAIASCLILAFMLTGCTTTKPKYSGWLETGYTKLKEDPDYPGSMIWVTTDNVLKTYDKVMFDEVAIHVDPELGEDREKVDPEVINQMTSYLKESMTKEFSKDYEVVDRPGKGVVRVRIALTAVQLTKKELKAYQFVPVALVLTAATEAVGMRNKMAVLNMEGVAMDSLTGQTIAMVVQRYSAETSVQTATKMTIEDAKPVLDYWVQKMKGKFDRAHGKGE